MSFYFDCFEGRRPPAPVNYSARRELLWQYLAVICLALGGWYIAWRWTASLNWHAVWFSIPLVLAETGAYIGLVLFTFNLWKTSDLPIVAPPYLFNECLEEPLERDRLISVDIFITTFNEDPELVRLSIRDAAALRYPHPIKLCIHVLDDGRRETMRAIAAQERVGYLTRPDNKGFKAGNLRNAIENTSGDFIVICDADTRLFPTFLERTMGYFRDSKMAWVQTPQWFFDLPEGRRLPDVLGSALGTTGRLLGKGAERLIGPVTLGADPFVNDPQMFYDVILRRRNWANAAFCCGAGSIHRREAAIEAALREYSTEVERSAAATIKAWSRVSRERSPVPELLDAVRREAAISEEFTPYKFHVSEDIFSSLVLHQDRAREWKSYVHPYVESKMLSPQDLLSWTIQRFKYAGGTLDIFIHHSPLLRRGLNWPQRLMYASTFWSYLGALWNILFLLAPIVYLATGIAPVKAYTMEFVIRIVPFLLATELAFMVGTWGISGYRSKASYLSFFSVNLQALWTVLAGKTIGFKITPKERQAGRHGKLALPQLAIIVATITSIAFALVSWKLGHRHYTAAGLLSNIFWGLGNVLALSGIVLAAFRDNERVADPETLEDRVASSAGSGAVTASPAHPRIIPERRIELDLNLTEPPTQSGCCLSPPVRDRLFGRSILRAYSQFESEASAKIGDDNFLSATRRSRMNAVRCRSG